MATKKNSNNKKLEENAIRVVETIQAQAEETYDNLLTRFQLERGDIERALRHEYRSARRYIRAHPEQGVGLAFLTGLLVGILLTKGDND